MSMSLPKPEEVTPELLKLVFEAQEREGGHIVDPVQEFYKDPATLWAEIENLVPGWREVLQQTSAQKNKASSQHEPQAGAS